MQPLFRWKTPEWKWVYGYYVKIPFPLHTEHRIYLFEQKDCEEEYVVVLPQSVWQWTGLVDKNNVKIFKGDIIRRIWLEKYTREDWSEQELKMDEKYLIEWYQESCQFIARDIQYWNSQSIAVAVQLNQSEIIWNTTDTPELLK